jgi:AcrR family transcriptional regulator
MVTPQPAAEPCGPRRRDSAATRSALLTAARLHLTRGGFEGTSTREVAATAGVNQTLVYRYFGSKEKLFEEAAAQSDAHREAQKALKDVPLEQLPKTLLDVVLHAGTTWGGSGPPDGFIAFLTAASHDSIRELICDRLTTTFSEDLGSRLPGADPELRAELFAATLIGLSLMRHKIGTPALAVTDRDTLAPYVDSIGQVLFAAPATKAPE